MNLGDIKTRVKRQFGDESGVQVTDADIVRWVNDAQRDIVMQNEELLEKTATIDSVATQQSYDFPSDLFILRSIRYKGSLDDGYRHLKYLNLQQFDELLDGWDSNSLLSADSIAVGWYTSYESKIYLYPTPNESIVGAIKILYSRLPVDVANDVDNLDLPIYYHNAVSNYCLQKAYELDEDFDAANFAAQQVQADVKLNKEKEKIDNAEFYPVISVRYEDM